PLRSSTTPGTSRTSPSRPARNSPRAWTDRSSRWRARGSRTPRRSRARKRTGEGTLPCLDSVTTGSVSQIRAPHRLVVADHVGGTGNHRAPGLQDGDLLREIERERRILLHQQDRDTLLGVDPVHDAEDL